MLAAVPNATTPLGEISAWPDCGSVPAARQIASAHKGRLVAAMGTTGGGEIAGDAGVCRQVVIPTARRVLLDYWAQAASTEKNATHAYQEVAFYDGTSAPDKSKPYLVLVHDVANTNGFQHFTFDITELAGQTLYVSFGVHGDGNPDAHTSLIVDDASLVVESPERRSD